MKQKIFHKIFIYLTLILIASSTYAQIRTGTLEEVMQDDGYIFINGKRFTYSVDVVVSYDNNVVSSVYLTTGIKVNYTLKQDGSLKTIRLLGPRKQLNEMYQN